MGSITGFSPYSQIFEKRKTRVNPALNREISTLSSKTLLSARHKQLMWQTAAAVVTVGFITLTTFGNLILSLYTPYYFFFAALGTFSLMPTIPPVVKWMLRKAENYQIDVDVNRKIEQKFKKYNAMKSSKVEEVLQKMGMDPQHLKQVNDLKSIKEMNAGIAKYRVWAKQSEVLDKHADRLDIESVWITDRKQLKKRRLEILDIRHRLMREAKLHASYFYGLLQEATYKGNLAGICDVFSYRHEERLIAGEFEDKQSSAFIKFKERSFGKITTSTFDDLSVPEVAQRLFQAI
jgi:hypothetical protein